MKFNVPAIGAVIVLIATIAGVYYTGHSAGRNSVNLKQLERDNADLIRFAKSQQDIYEHYDSVLAEIYKTPAQGGTVGPVLSATIDRLPGPAKN